MDEPNLSSEISALTLAQSSAYNRTEFLTLAGGPKDVKYFFDMQEREASNGSSFSDLSSKTLILSPSRLFTVT
jgi:hypothetical protein